MYDVVALGEHVLDFTPHTPGPMGNPTYEMNPGGSPINCLAAVSRLGGKTAFAGKFGDDTFGRFLERKMSEAGIDTSAILFTPEVHSTLGFVTLDESGDRSFDFFRKPGADITFTTDEMDFSLIDRTRIFHFSGLALTDDPLRTTCITAVKYAREKGIPVSYDPNYRAMLWENVDLAVKYMRVGLEYADYVKLSEEEMSLVTGLEPDQVEEGARRVFDMGKKAVFITLGKDGAYYLCDEGSGHVPVFKVDTVDTTGCGDAFMGSMLYTLCHMPGMDMAGRVRFACAVGALCSAGRGGVPAMPTLAQTEELLAAR